MRLILPVLVLGLSACPSTPPATPDGTPASSAVPPSPAVPTSAPDASSAPSATPSAAPAAPAPADPKPAADPADHKAAFLTAKPVFDQYCAPCHSNEGYSTSKEAIKHFDMSKYPFAGHHVGKIAQAVRVSVGATDKPATMPEGNPGGVKGEDLAKIVAWADAYDKAHPPKKNGHGDHSGHKH